MAFDATPGGDPRGPWCKSCKQPIEAGEPVETVNFDNDTHDVNGVYHQACSRPFVSIMRALTQLRQRPQV